MGPDAAPTADRGRALPLARGLLVASLLVGALVGVPPLVTQCWTLLHEPRAVGTVQLESRYAAVVDALATSSGAEDEVLVVATRMEAYGWLRFALYPLAVRPMSTARLSERLRESVSKGVSVPRWIVVDPRCSLLGRRRGAVEWQAWLRSELGPAHRVGLSVESSLALAFECTDAPAR